MLPSPWPDRPPPRTVRPRAVSSDFAGREGMPNRLRTHLTRACIKKRAQLPSCARKAGVSVKAAALQFALAHPAAAAAIPGATRPSRIAEDLGALREEVPAAFWQELRETGLLDPAAPLPAGA
ncbi:aldo/keto reductase [Streptomyces sp. NPDC001312]|uniref:aldo/keto reductase n=1 Tax=Streptomyces sp. NPDC001312 TaxID=3364561 RepID=UPI0036776463